MAFTAHLCSFHFHGMPGRHTLRMGACIGKVRPAERDKCEFHRYRSHSSLLAPAGAIEAVDHLRDADVLVEIRFFTYSISAPTLSDFISSPYDGERPEYAAVSPLISSSNLVDKIDGHVRFSDQSVGGERYSLYWFFESPSIGAQKGPCRMISAE
jgi:hypothetical protein